jgi:hypothetical protein
LGLGKRHGGESGPDSQDDSRDVGNKDKVVKSIGVVPMGASW